MSSTESEKALTPGTPGAEATVDSGNTAEPAAPGQPERTGQPGPITVTSPRLDLTAVNALIVADAPPPPLLHEDTFTTRHASVTLSTYYDPTKRASISVLVAYADAEEHEYVPPVQMVGGIDSDPQVATTGDTQFVLTAFTIDERPGAPDAALARQMHSEHSGEVDRVLQGEDIEAVANGDIISMVVEGAVSYRRPRRPA